MVLCLNSSFKGPGKVTKSDHTSTGILAEEPLDHLDGHWQKLLYEFDKYQKEILYWQRRYNGLSYGLSVEVFHILATALF